MEDTNWLKFLGTAGARIVVSKQFRASGGMWLSLHGINILIDPGPGSLVKCWSSRPKLDPTKLDAIILTHRHIDHSTDINAMIEAMTVGGFEPKGMLFTTEEAIGDNEPVIFSYVRKFVNSLSTFREGETYTIKDISFSTPLRHRHPAETYGLRFNAGFGVISFITDSLFIPELIDAYRGSDILVLNVVRYDTVAGADIQHLTLSDALTIIEAIRPKAAFLTHMGMTMLREKPHELAAQATEKLGIRVIAATDGMKADLEYLINNPVEVGKDREKKAEETDKQESSSDSDSI